MTQHKPPSKKSASRVDWSEPRLEALLKKTAGWQLDNRGAFPPQDIEIQLGWAAGDASVSNNRPGILVWEHDQTMVVETDFPIEQGELVRIEKPLGDSFHTVWGTLVESRPGQRADDDENGIHLHWISTR